MIELMLSIFIILTVILIIKCVVKSKKLYNTYLRELQHLGYRVYCIPFTAFGMQFFKILQRDQKDGDAFKIYKTIYPQYDIILSNSFNNVVIDLTHPDFIKDFYSSEHLYVYEKVKFFTGTIVRAMGKGIPFSQGSEWKRKRKIFNEVFNFQFVKALTGKIQILCDRAIKDVQDTAVLKKMDSISLSGVTDVKLQNQPLCLFMNRLVTDIIKQGFDPLSFLLGVRFLSLSIRKMDKDINRRIKLYRQWGLAYIDKKIQEAKNKIICNNDDIHEPDDIITTLVRTRQKNRSQDYYRNQEILEEFSSFFVAGTDTTSHYVMMMIYYIVQNPQVEQKLGSQIQQYMSDNNYSYQNLKNLKYIDWIQKQTTRIYCPISNKILRQAKTDNYLNGLPIKKGTIVTVQHMGNHYSQRYFKEPLAFRPERWEHECDEIPAFAVGGFSAGGGTCVGKHLVMVQSKIGLIKFMKRYKEIRIPKENIKMVIKFVYSADYFKFQNGCSLEGIDKEKGGMSDRFIKFFWVFLSIQYLI